MRKTLLNSILAAGVVFTILLCQGCGSTKTENTTSSYSLPKELQDCTIHALSSERETSLVAMRCPASTTSLTYTVGSGKTAHQETTVVVEASEKTRVLLPSGKIMYMTDKEIELYQLMLREFTPSEGQVGGQ